MNEIKENVINKNFMITYDFSDNDFGGHIEDAIETWVDKWNSVVSNIKTWLNMRNSLPSNIKSYVDSNSEDMIKSKLEKLEDVTNISKCNEIMIEEKKRIKIARRDKKENDGRKKGQEKMPRRDNKKRCHEEITRKDATKR